MPGDVSQPFYEQFRGSFYGLLRWQELEDFWRILKRSADNGWYVYALGEAPPHQTLTRDQFIRFIDEVDVLLHREHTEAYCGIVYVDNKTEPAFIKVYDPNNLGVVCGSSAHPPLPAWVISRCQPVDLPSVLQTRSRRRWWQKLWA
ncbi:MAG: hypothetical protein HY080_16575 [Gammaproteobacteria bacterium]|nr:hypothetical protein [Gammaproteobacteria bacterium]